MDGWERDEENQTQERQNQKETTTTTTTAAVAAEKLNTWYSLCMYTTGTHQLIIWVLSAGVLTRWSDKRGAYVYMLVALQLLPERKVLIKFSQARFGTTRGPSPPRPPFNPTNQPHYLVLFRLEKQRRAHGGLVRSRKGCNFCKCLNILTLRLLMSYIYMEHLFLMFLDHTQRRSTVGRTPLDE